MKTENEIAKTETQWPLWKAALAKLRSLPNFGYGLTLDLSWFERELSCRRDTSEFAFGLMQIRQLVEYEDGYYIQTQTIRDDESGTKQEIAQIPCAADHEVVARGFESRMRTFAARAVDLRVKTLGNRSAIDSMTQEERQRMEKSSEIAATRAVLLRREKSITAFVKKHQPKLLASEHR